MWEHDAVIKWKYFPRYWPFVWGIHWSPVNSPHKGQGCGALMFSLICALINAWVNNREAGDLRCHRTHYDVTVMMYPYFALQYHIWPGVTLVFWSCVQISSHLHGSKQMAANYFCNKTFMVLRIHIDIKKLCYFGMEFGTFQSNQISYSLTHCGLVTPYGDMAQVMACCLRAPSHYLNQCWLIIGEAPWHSSQGIILRWSEDTNQ